jgi:hypothetical protein
MGRDGSQNETRDEELNLKVRVLGAIACYHWVRGGSPWSLSWGRREAVWIVKLTGEMDCKPILDN